MPNIVETITSVAELVAADAVVLTDPIIKNLILDALVQFSQQLPRVVLKDVTGDGTQEYALPSDSGLEWDNDFSSVAYIEYPTGNVPPTYLTEGATNDYIIYRSATATYVLQFLTVTPSTTETIRLAYTLPWSSTNIASIPSMHHRSFVYLTSVLACEFLARFYTKSSESAMGADILDFRDKASTWAGRAKDLRSRYNELLGISKSEDVKPASSTSDWDTTYSFNRNYLTHSTVYR